MKNKDSRSISSPIQLSKLEDALLYRFENIEILKTAIKHSSNSNKRLESNERLEFLGDRVLGTIIANMLYCHFPSENEGDLAYRFTSLVRARSLARIAEKLNLGAYIKLPDGPLENFGKRRTRILSDACEAIIAAIFLDGGYEQASSFVETHWREMLVADVIPPKDAKTKLQEWAQENKLPVPNYIVLKQTGPDHNPTFTVKVTIDNKRKKSSKATGRSKQAAEIQAAGQLFDMINDNKRD